jgi:hypothetical protein
MTNEENNVLVGYRHGVFIHAISSVQHLFQTALDCQCMVAWISLRDDEVSHGFHQFVEYLPEGEIEQFDGVNWVAFDRAMLKTCFKGNATLLLRFKPSFFKLEFLCVLPNPQDTWVDNWSVRPLMDSALEMLVPLKIRTVCFNLIKAAPLDHKVYGKLNFRNAETMLTVLNEWRNERKLGTLEDFYMLDEESHIFKSFPTTERWRS